MKLESFCYGTYLQTLIGSVIRKQRFQLYWFLLIFLLIDTTFDSFATATYAQIGHLDFRKQIITSNKSEYNTIYIYKKNLTVS